MSKRTKLKLRNIRMYLAKYVFNGRYIVRNILAATVLMTVVVLIAGASMVLGDMKAKNANSEVVLAEETFTIDAYEITSVKSESISVLKTDLEGKTQAVVQANETQMVAGATNEFDSMFIAIEDGINVRKEASTESDIIGTLNTGAVGNILSSDGEWLKISSGDVTGYVKAEFVLTGTAAAKYAEEYQSVNGTVTEDGVYVRAEASKEADIIESASKGDTYKVDKSLTTSEWVCVYLSDDSKGYIYAEFITVTEGYPTAAAEESDNEESEEDKDEDGATGSIEEVTTEESQEEEPTTEEPTTEEPTTEAPTTEQTTTEDDNESGNKITVGTTNRGAISLSEEDINLMASIMTLECGGESYEGQLAVANVIINRLLSGNYGSTISDVVYAPYQFSVATSPQLDYYIQNGAQASCLQAAREAASGVNNVGSFMYFRPTWNVDTSTLGTYTVIGNHVFY